LKGEMVMTLPVTEARGAEDTKIAEAMASEAFDSAFEEASVVGDKAELSPADNPDNHKDELPPEPAVVTPVSEVTPTPPSESAPETPDPALQQPGETDEKYEQRYKTLQGIHKHDMETWKTREAELLAQVEAAKVQPVTPAATPTPTDTEASRTAFIDSLTEEQKAQLAEYEQDFDVVSRMEGMKRNIEMAKLRKEFEASMKTWQDELTTRFTSSIAPAIKLVEETETEAHFNAIKTGYVLDDGTTVSGHTDFEKYRDDGSLKAWIESKPAYLRPALEQTYSQGSAMDVIDLISDFKRESNINPNPQPSDNVVSMTPNPTRTAKKHALASVVTRKGAVAINSAVASDFEGAFDEALNK
jgi:hypothetical protein